MLIYVKYSNYHVATALNCQSHTINSTLCLFHFQTQSKASTLSSGARAAAQILNVPLERLESRQAQQQQQNQRELMTQAQAQALNNGHHVVNNNISSSNHMHNNGINNTNSQHNNSNVMEYEERREKALVSAVYHRNSIDSQHDGNMNEALLQARNAAAAAAALNHAEQNGYSKQTSYLHSSRKVSNQQQQQQQQQLLAEQQGGEIVYGHHPQQQLQEESVTPPSVTKYSLLQFAMQHFRNE